MSDNTECFLALKKLTKRFQKITAVDNISIRINRGEFITLLGPSGSGKTTTLLMIAGFLQPTSGDIELNGESLLKKPPYKRDIGMVFQHYALFPHMTVFKNISFSLEMRRMDKEVIVQKVEQALELVRLRGFEMRYPQQLSGGQQQRVALARALVFNPSVLLMDEPLGALDRNLREQMQLEIRRLHGTLGITVVYVTHDQEEALVMSDRVAVMNKGRIEQIASPDKLYEKPINAFVADFIGESVLLEATIERRNIEDGNYLLRNTDGLQIVASYSDEIPKGTHVYAAIRPSRFSILNQGEAQINEYAGVVKEVIFLGEVTKYKVHLIGGTTIALREINRGEARRLEPGDQVKVGCSEHDVRILSKEGS